MNNPDILAYNQAQAPGIAAICEHLMNGIATGLPDASVKLYHANPVWFINENPIVGYDVSSDHVNLLFWSGQSFDEPALIAKGSFKAAGTSYKSVNQIDDAALAQWLKKSVAMQWDYKNIREHKGELRKLLGEI